VPMHPPVLQHGICNVIDTVVATRTIQIHRVYTMHTAAASMSESTASMDTEHSKISRHTEAEALDHVCAFSVT
jgi:hypothetical protein